MANVFQKGTKFAQTAIALLKREVKAPGLFVHKFGISDFRGASGDVVNIKRPPILRAREKNWRGTDSIVVDEIAQSKIQVTLNKHPYSAVALTSEEETLDEVDYVRDVQAPQVRAILEYFEEGVIGALRGAKYVLGTTYNPSASDDTADPRKVAVQARKLFQDKHVPTSGRYWLVGSSVSAAIASHDKLQDVDTAGVPEALREGVVGKLGGFIIVEIDALDEDESYFVHNTAVAIATVAPVVPQGAAKGGGVAAGQGLAVTQLWDYDATKMVDRSVVHAFTGATVVTDPEIDPETGLIAKDSDGTPRMEFVRAIKVTFGAGAGSTAWKVSALPASGTYTLSVDGTATEPIAFDATNAAIADALNALEGVSGVKVTGTTEKTVKFTESVTLAGTVVTVAKA